MDAAEKREESRIDVKTRRLQKSGSSLYVAIPREFAKRMNLLPGEEVIVVSKGDTIRVMPIKES